MVISPSPVVMWWLQKTQHGQNIPEDLLGWLRHKRGWL